MFTLRLCLEAMMPPVRITTEEKIDLQQVRGPVSVYRFAFLALALAGLFVALIAKPQAATAAGVSGQLDAWELELGTEPGELINPHQFGVDPVDGSAYVVNYPSEEEARIDKYSVTGTFEGSVPVSLTPEDSEAVFKKLVGIAVDHADKRFYLVQNEWGLDTTTGLEGAVATKVLAYSTELSSPGHLGQPVQTFALPAKNGPETILWATEIHVDPTSHDLVIAATSATGHPILQRVSATGTLGARYEESGSHLVVGGLGEAFFGFDIGEDGTTFIVTNASGSNEPASIEGFTLPPDFTSSSTLTALPGFLDAATAGDWQANAQSFLVTPSNLFGEAFGPQLALVTKPSGEEILYWKAGIHEERRQAVRVHGYSLQQRAAVAGFGGGPNNASGHECSIQVQASSLAATTNGDLLVLEPGGEELTGSGLSQWFPTVLRFGAGGSGCPDPAPSIRVKEGSNPDVGTVAAGTQVTLDAGGSELGGLTPSEFVWTITKQGGSPETIPVTGAPPATETPHVFAEAGNYTIQLSMKTTENLSTGGSLFAAEPKTLTVTPGATGPVVTGVSPNHGTPAGGETVEITGTGLAGATKVEFGSAVVNAPFAEDTATKIKLAAPACTDGEVVHVTVTTAEGKSATSAADQFTCGQVATPTVTGISPTHGPAAGGTVVTITGTGLTGATEVKFGSAPASAVTPVSATEVKATSPAGTGKVHVVVVTGGGTSTTGGTDEFTYDAAAPTHSLTVTKAGSGSGSFTCNRALCQSAYPAGSTVVLHATADPGSTFVGWGGGGCAGAGDCTIVLNANTSVVATFNTNPPDDNNPSTSTNSPTSTQSGSTNTTPGGSTQTPGGSKHETAAEKLKEKQRKALQKCKKLHGKAAAQCVKKAKQIGKPKKKAKKK